MVFGTKVVHSQMMAKADCEFLFFFDESKSGAEKFVNNQKHMITDQ